VANRLLSGISGCVFDAYGTLFDFASAARACADMLGDQVERVSALWRDKQLQYTWLRAAQGLHADFWQVTGDALDFTLETLGFEQPSLRESLMALYLALEPFPEVPGVLATLRRAGLKTAILSNGTPAMLDAVVRRAGLAGMFDAVLSVEEAGVFKPDPRVSVVKCLGRLRGLGLRHESGLVQPLRAKARTAAGRAGLRDQDARGFAGAGRTSSSRRMMSAVAASAGKKDSIASFDKVISSGAPKSGLPDFGSQ
jgi:2-haloalkanoic acid dehalogenase type II